MGKAGLGLLVLVAIVAVVLALMGKNPIIIGGLSLTWIAMILIVLEFTPIPAYIPGWKNLTGKANPTTLGYAFVVLLLINFGVIGAWFSGAGSGSGGGIVPAASMTGAPTQAGAATAPATTGQMSVPAEFEFFADAATGGAYAGNGDIYLSNQDTRYNLHKKVTDAGGSSGLKLGNGLSPSASVSSGEFSISGLSLEIGKIYTVFQYTDTTPAAAETRSTATDIKITGVQGLDTPKFTWTYADGSTGRLRLPNYGTFDWYDDTETVRNVYNEAETSSAQNKIFTVKVIATNNGEQMVDGGLYLESPSSNAGNIQQIDIQGPTKKVSYTALQNADLLSTQDPVYLAAPSKVTSTNTMYYVGPFPEEPIRESASEKNTFTITVRYDHPGSGNWNWYLAGVQNLNAKSSTNGHIDFADDINVNATQHGTDGWT